MKHNKLARNALAVVLFAATGASMAQEGPWYVGAEQQFTRNSNLFREPDGRELSDTISTTSLRGGLNLQVSRQRFFGDVAIRHNRYQDNDAFDHTAYGLNAGWNWETIGNLSGTLRYSANESLVNYVDYVGALIVRPTTPVRERNQEFLARGRFGMHGPMSLEATYVHRNRDFTNASLQANEFSQDSLSAGVLYRPSGLLELGLALRGTRGEFPSATPVDEYDRSDVDLTAVWTPTGLSRVGVRLSYSKEDHTARSDFSGVTGSLSWDYRPTGKLRFVSELVRDTGNEASFNGYQFVAGSATGDNSFVARIARVRATYEATAKIRATANAAYIDRDLLAGGSDKTGLVGIGAEFQAARSVLLGCSLSHEKRGGDAQGYTQNIAGCFGRLTLQ